MQKHGVHNAWLGLTVLSQPHLAHSAHSAHQVLSRASVLWKLTVLSPPRDRWPWVSARPAQNFMFTQKVATFLKALRADSS